MQTEAPAISTTDTSSPRLSHWGFIWDWDKINTIGEKSVLKSSYVFLAIVPIAAKMFAHLPDELSLTVFNQTVRIHTALPFNWVALFFCALFVTVGNILYAICCPVIVRSFQDYAEFNRSGRDCHYLAKHLKEVAAPFATNSSILNAIQHVNKRVLAQFDSASGELPFQALKSIDGELTNNPGYMKPELSPATFYFVRDAAVFVKRPIRITVSVAYTIGFILLAFIMAQNIWFVFSYVWKRLLVPALSPG